MTGEDKTQEVAETLTRLKAAGEEFTGKLQNLDADKLIDLKAIDVTRLEEAFRQIEAALSELQELRMKAIEATYVATPVTFRNLAHELRVHFYCLAPSGKIAALTRLINERTKEIFLASPDKLVRKVAAINATTQEIINREKSRREQLEDENFKKTVKPLLRKHGREKMLAALEKVHTTGDVLERAKKLLGID